MVTVTMRELANVFGPFASVYLPANVAARLVPTTGRGVFDQFMLEASRPDGSAVRRLRLCTALTDGVGVLLQHP